MKPNNYSKKSYYLKPYDNSDIKKLNDYIDSNLIDTLDYESALDEVLNLANYLEENKSSINRSLIYEIVSDNQILNSLLNTIVENLEDFHNLEFDNEILISLIRAYLMQNNLIPMDEEEFQDVVDFDYYITSDHFDKNIPNPYSDDENTNLTYEEELIKTYYPLLKRTSKFFATGRIPFSDLVQESYLDLDTAINDYDATRNVPLNAYIQQHINRYLRKYIKLYGNQNHFSCNILEFLPRLKKAIYEFNQQGISYTKEDLAKIINVSPKRIDYLLSINPEPLNIDDLDEYISPLNETLEDAYIDSFDINILDIIEKSTLTSLAKQIIIEYYGLKDNKPKSEMEIAELLSKSHQLIGSTKLSSLDKLIKNIRIIDLIDYANNPDAVISKLENNLTLAELIVNSLLIDYQNIFKIPTLNDMEKDILSIHYGLGNNTLHTLKEIADKYNTYPNEIVEIEARIFYKIAVSDYNIPYADLVKNKDEEIEAFKQRKKSIYSKKIRLKF